MRERAGQGACPSGEALTALAHGEGAPDERAALLRHLIACPVCRPEHAGAERMLLALRGLGAARASAAPVRASAARARFEFVPPVVAAAVVGVAIFAAFHRPTAPSAPARDAVAVVAAARAPL